MSARAFLATTIALLFSVPAFAHRQADANDLSGAIVLCYHIVESPLDPRMEISRATFQQHLQYLEMTGYNVIPLRDLYECVPGTRHRLPPTAVVIASANRERSPYDEPYHG